MNIIDAVIAKQQGKTIFREGKYGTIKINVNDNYSFSEEDIVSDWLTPDEEKAYTEGFLDRESWQSQMAKEYHKVYGKTESNDVEESKVNPYYEQMKKDMLDMKKESEPMKRTYILQRDLPDSKAGDEYIYLEYQRAYYKNGEFADSYWMPDVVENSPDWFRMKEPPLSPLEEAWKNSGVMQIVSTTCPNCQHQVNIEDDSVKFSFRKGWEASENHRNAAHQNIPSLEEAWNNIRRKATLIEAEPYTDREKCFFEAGWQAGVKWITKVS